MMHFYRNMIDSTADIVVSVLEHEYTRIFMFKRKATIKLRCNKSEEEKKKNT